MSGTEQMLTAMFAAAVGQRDGAAGRIAALTEQAGTARLGWLIPPEPMTMLAAADRILNSYRTRPERLCLVGTGGWAFAARAIAEATGTERLAVLDIPDHVDVERAVRPATGPLGCLSVSVSGATFETIVLTQALAVEGVPIRCLGGRQLSVRGIAEHIAMFGAPLTTAFAMPAVLADPGGAARAYRHLAAGYRELAADAVRTAASVEYRATFALPPWAGDGLRLWMRQLAQQALGGKPGATISTVEPATPPRCSVDYTGTTQDLIGLVSVLYHFGVFTAALGLRQGLPICRETNVHHYKQLLPSVPSGWPAGARPLRRARLGAALAEWSAGDPVEIVDYHGAAVPDAEPGPRWNHHSFQACWADPGRRVAVIAGPATDPLSEARRRIAVATYCCLQLRSALFVVTDK